MFHPCVAPAKKSIFCCADFGSTIALDLQQKLLQSLSYIFSRTNGNAIFSWNLFLFRVVQKLSSLNFCDF